MQIIGYGKNRKLWIATKNSGSSMRGLGEVQERVNDVYLKVNGQAEGVRTYGRVVELMVLDFQYRR